jgi:hypothetical protein
MKRKNRNILQALAGLLLALLFLYLTFKNKPLDEIFESIGKAKWNFVLLNGIFLIITFFLRSLRWRILVEHLGYKVKKRNIILAVTLGYFVNSFTPKLGEIVRCSVLQQNSKVPLVRSLGSVVSERIYDLLVLGMGLITIIILEFNRVKELFGSFTIKQFTDKWEFTDIFIYLIPLLLIVLVIYLFASGKIMRKVRMLFKEMLHAMKKTLQLKRYGSFLILTILIWIALIGMNYVALKALPNTNNTATPYFAIVVLFIGGLGWALPTPGGVGTTHYFILQLFVVFNLDSSAGISFGILSNGLTFVYTLLIGFAALIYYFIIVKKKIFSSKRKKSYGVSRI